MLTCSAQVKEVNLEETRHIPVLEEEVLQYLQAESGGRYLDCTLGGGGHTQALLDAHKDSCVVSADRDRRAVDRARRRFAAYNDRLTLLHGSFSELQRLLPELGPQKFNGMLADLGLSSDQLAENRGFGFQDSAPLDMRMDEAAVFSAEQLINQAGEQELYRLLKAGGVGREARAAARAIVRNRPFQTTRELAEAVQAAVNLQRAGKKTNPATVVFQAVRMAVNSEREELERLLDAAAGVLEDGGRLVIISFHSLEDRIVTSRLRRLQQGDTSPAWWPKAGPGAAPQGRLLTPKAVTPSEREVERNPRARSARLRAFEFGGVRG